MVANYLNKTKATPPPGKLLVPETLEIVQSLPKMNTVTATTAAKLESPKGDFSLFPGSEAALAAV